MTPDKVRETVIDWARTIAGAVLVYCAFTTVAFANYRIPSESMVPHLEVGDQVTVAKYAYGYSRYSLPFGIGALLPSAPNRLFQSLPHRGDVVVFIDPTNGRTLIKRAIGLPGDVIEVHNRQLILNGVEAHITDPVLLVRQSHDNGRQFVQRYEETIPGGYTHAANNLTDHGDLDNFGPYRVPDGHVFFMGDNRDDSADSRWSGLGPIPIENLVGRAEIIYATAMDNDCGGNVACPMERWMRPLHH